MAKVEPTAPAGEAAASLWWLLAVLVLASVNLIFVWGFRYFPTVDGPAHLHLVTALARFDGPAGDFYRRYFTINPQIAPNLLIQALLYLLVRLFDPFTAEKILLSLYMLGLPLALYWVLRAVAPAHTYFALLGVPLVINFPLSFGFYNFCFAFIVVLLWFGYWWRTRWRFTLPSVLGHMGFGLLAYATHLFAVAAAGLSIGLCAFTSMMGLYRYGKTDDTSGSRGAYPHPWLGHMAAPLIGGLTAILPAAYFVATGVDDEKSPTAFLIGFHRVLEFFAAGSIVSFGSAELWGSISFSIGTVILLSYAIVRWRDQAIAPGVPLLVCCAGFLLLYFFLPMQFVYRWIPYRLQPVLYLFWVIALARLASGARHRLLVRRLAIATALLSTCLLTVARWPIFERLNQYYDEYVQGAHCIAEHSTLVAVVLNRTWQGRVFPSFRDGFVQTAGHLAILRDSVDLKNFQAARREHPINFRDGHGAYGIVADDRGFMALPSRVDLAAYERVTGKPIDYILYWGVPAEAKDKTALAALDAQVQTHYTPTFRSTPWGLMTIYRHRDIPAVARCS